MHWDAERQRVVVRVPQQDGDDLHTRRSGLPLPVRERPLHGPLAVHGILPHLAPGRTEVEREWVWYPGNGIFGGSPWVCVALQVLFQVPQEMLLGKEESDAQGQQLPALQGIKDHFMINAQVWNKTTHLWVSLPVSGSGRAASSGWSA